MPCTPHMRCDGCRNWQIVKPLERHGSCSIVGSRRRRSNAASCPSWRPVFREVGDLRKPLTADYKNWLRIAAVRRLYAHKFIDATVAVALLAKGASDTIARSRRAAMDGWEEHIAAKKEAA